MPRRRRQPAPNAAIIEPSDNDNDKGTGTGDCWTVPSMPLHVVAPYTPVTSSASDDKPAEGGHHHRPGRQQRNNADSLNHLLSFSLPPRQHPIPRTSRRSGRQHPGSSWARPTRERYINAQYRFMLKPTGDYTVHFADPDIYFQWQNVLQVIVPTSTVLRAAAHTFEGPSVAAHGSGDSESLIPSCPICLSEPVAARMTKCGHIFCFPCILHYLELADGGLKYRSCPICYDVVYRHELKSVKWFDPVSAASDAQASMPTCISDQPPPQTTTLDSVDSTQDEVASLDAPANSDAHSIVFRLIHRTTISTLALPKSTTWPSELVPPHSAPWFFTPDALSFARFMLATPDYMASELKDELSQLKREELTLEDVKKRLPPGSPASDDLGLVFVQAAMRKVHEQLEKVELLRTDPIQQASEAAMMDFDALRINAISESSASRNAQAHPSANHPTNRNHRQRRNVNPPAPPNDTTYCFYQAASGQHIYLHPLDIKILKSHFETYSAFPLSIRVTVGGTEEGSMDDELRRKCRYLAHLPEACDLTFVEADLSNVVPAAALEPYSQALKKRVAKRREKAKKDDKARARSEQVQAEKEKGEWSRSLRGVPSYVEPGGEGAAAAYPGLRDDLARVTSNESDVNTQDNSISASGTSPLPAHTGPKTVWGTRVVAAADVPQRSRHHGVHVDDDYDDPAYEALERAWQDLAVEGRGGRRQGRKKKVVLNLAGGAVSIRR